MHDLREVFGGQYAGPTIADDAQLSRCEIDVVTKPEQMDRRRRHWAMLKRVRADEIRQGSRASCFRTNVL